MNKYIKTKDLISTENKIIKPFLERFEYPWEALPEIKGYIKELIKNGIEGYTLIGEDVLVGENVKIYPTATIEGPTIIGSNTEIRPGAFIRGSVLVGEKCVIGNSTEMKNAVLCNGVQVPHYNYVGDSVLGDKAHMGAGSILSNFKAGGSNVVIHADKDYVTGLRKIGAMLGDYADIGCGAVLNPGTIIGKGTRVYPLTCCRGIYPENAIVKSNDNIVEMK